ncbi:hypothetical protein Hanom_Chr09g00801001 [Helianthus anomalus]
MTVMEIWKSQLSNDKEKLEDSCETFGKQILTNELGHKYEFIDPYAKQRAEEDVDMVDEEDETENAGPREPK